MRFTVAAAFSSERGGLALLGFIKLRVENVGSHAHAVCSQHTYKFSGSSTACRVFSVNVNQLELSDGESSVLQWHELRAGLPEPLWQVAAVFLDSVGVKQTGSATLKYEWFSILGMRIQCSRIYMLCFLLPPSPNPSFSSARLSFGSLQI